MAPHGGSYEPGRHPRWMTKLAAVFVRHMGRDTVDAAELRSEC